MQESRYWGVLVLNKSVKVNLNYWRRIRRSCSWCTYCSLKPNVINFAGDLDCCEGVWAHGNDSVLLSDCFIDCAGVGIKSSLKK